MTLSKLSLFSGIGGDDLASEWAGIETKCFVEIDKFCQKILKKHWPNVPIIEDIHDVTKEKVKKVCGQDWFDIIAGGDPCQPRSIAGKRRGREDDRDLWQEMFRVICELKPTWVVNENPTGRLTMDFHEVLSDLESQGYETRSFVIPACAVNAWHRRDRLFVVAYRNTRFHNSKETIFPRRNTTELCYKSVANSNCQGLAKRKKQKLLGKCQATIRGAWQESWLEVATTLCRMADGFPNRVARLKALGNSQVPQQVYPIYRGIVRVSESLLSG